MTSQHIHVTTNTSIDHHQVPNKSRSTRQLRAKFVARPWVNHSTNEEMKQVFPCEKSSTEIKSAALAVLLNCHVCALRLLFYGCFMAVKSGFHILSLLKGKYDLPL